MHVLIRLIDIYGDDIVIMPDLTEKCIQMLRDPQDNLRQLAIQVLSLLYLFMGDSLVVNFNRFLYPALYHHLTD